MAETNIHHLQNQGVQLPETLDPDERDFSTEALAEVTRLEALYALPAIANPRHITPAISHEVVLDLHGHTEYIWERDKPWKIWEGWPSENVGYYPLDAVLKAVKRRDKAIEKGQPPERTLGGFALTGHDTLTGVSEAIAAGDENGIVVVPGVEVTCRPSKWGPTGIHQVILLPRDAAMHLEGKRNALPRPMWHSFEYVTEFAHDLGGIAVAVHPRVRGDKVSVSYEYLAAVSTHENPKRRVDAIEAVFPSGLQEASFLLELAQELDRAPIGSSDFHKLKHLGRIATRIWGLPENYTSDDVLKSIAEKKTWPVLLKKIGKQDQLNPLQALLVQKFGGKDHEETEHRVQITAEHERRRKGSQGVLHAA